MDNIYEAGNTIRLTCQFKDFNDLPKDPDIIKVTIYNQEYTIIHTANIGAENRVTEGEYYYDYLIPNTLIRQKVYYEWYGEIAGSPSLKRSQFRVAFMVTE